MAERSTTQICTICLTDYVLLCSLALLTIRFYPYNFILLPPNTRLLSNQTQTEYLEVARTEDRWTHLPLTPIIRRHSRFIFQNLLHVLHYFVCQLRQQLQCLAIIVDLLHLCGPQYHRAHILVLCRPRQC